MWDKVKAKDERLNAKWDSLPEEEKRRREREYDDGFRERVSDDPTGDHDD